ncbi:MAG: hypothetical protein R3C18_13415 [Planctomycetaceae bacterium]
MSILVAIASHANSEEYQVDRTIVWIMIPDHGMRTDWIAEGQAIFDAVWRDKRAVVRLSQSQFDLQHPEFQGQSTSGLTTEPLLAVRGIWIRPIDGSALYEVYDVSPLEMSNIPGEDPLPNEFTVDIARDRHGALTILS